MEIVAGKVDADLGGCLFKKRIAKPGRGKSGGFRTIVGYRRPNTQCIIFLYGFPKNKKADISMKEEVALRIVAEAFISANDAQIVQLLVEREIWEIERYE